MHNFHDLAKRCKHYRLKRFFLFLIIGFVLLCFAAGFFLYSKQPKTPSLSVSKEKEVVHTEKSKRQKQLKKPVQKADKTTFTKTRKRDDLSKKSLARYSLQFLVVKKENAYRAKKRKKVLEAIGFRNCKLTPYSKYIYLSCNATDNKKELNKYIDLAKRKKIDFFVDVHHYTKKETKTKQRTKQKAEKKQAIKKSRQASIAKEVPKIKKAPEPMLQVQNINLKQLEQSFSKTPSYNTALLLARNYYTDKAYKKAIYWAKKASEFNKESADSWLIYAKSLYALGRKKQAKQLLHIYLQYEYSDEVKSLLNQWENAQ